MKQVKDSKKIVMVDNLGEAFERDVRPYIEVIDNLRKHGLQNHIKLPNVVVVGDQSSGKSSIIEALSGIQLPRGRGIVTRCPLELQLKRMLNNVKWRAVLSFKGIEHVIEKPQDVQNIIIKAQNEICGGSRNISDELLTLRIESNTKNAPELTLIDLPGIARTVMDGQDKDNPIKIKEIIKKFVKNENTVILCVVSANIDIEVNEALDLAKEFDPGRERTLGVITKPDLAENHQKNEILKLLNNEVFKLKKGYRMVKCRSQEELENQLPLNEAMIAENVFFNMDKFYRHADPNLLGTMNLSMKITEELVNVIKNTIPILKENIKDILDRSKRELDKLPRALPRSHGEVNMFLNEIFYEMIKDIEILLTIGTNLKSNQEKNTFQNWRPKFENFQKELTNIQRESFNNEFCIQNLTRKLNAARGREICCFLNYEVFENLSSEHVQKYHPKAQILLNDLKNLTEEALMDVTKHFLEHLPLVKRDIQTIVSQAIEKCASSAEQNLNFIFDEEKIVFAMDSVFQKEMTDLKNTTRINLECNADLMQNVLRGYLKIVLNRLCDTIPMTIRQWIHIRLKNVLRDAFLKYSSDGGYDGKIMENEDIRRKRENLSDKIRQLELAKNELFHFK